MNMRITRRDWGLGAISAAGSLVAPGLAPGAPQITSEPHPRAVGDDSPPRFDGGGRLTVPVVINGRGPCMFAVDSAASASVISRELADELDLEAGGAARIHTLIGHEPVDLAIAARIRSGSVDVRNHRLVLATRAGLGVDGLIGVDLLKGQRLHLNFRRRRTFIGAGRPSPGGLLDRGRFTVRFHAPPAQRFADLLLIDVHRGALPVKAIIDTGAQVSVINTTMARAAGCRPIVLLDGSRERRVQSPTGLSAPATPMMLDLLQFGDITLRNLPVLVGDFHVFDLWNLNDRPAMLLGVDVMKLFERVVVDLRRAELVLQV